MSESMTKYVIHSPKRRISKIVCKALRPDKAAFSQCYQCSSVMGIVFWDKAVFYYRVRVNFLAFASAGAMTRLPSSGRRRSLDSYRYGFNTQWYLFLRSANIG